MAQHQRNVRNYLIDPSFQLKYTGMVLAVTFVVASFLGYHAYKSSKEQGQIMAANLMSAPGVSAETAQYIISQAHDAQTLFAWKIIGGILFLLLVLAATGIVITHRIVGPAYRLKRLFDELADGHLRISTKLRKGDELSDVFVAYERLVERLRERQAGEIAKLDAAIASSGDSAASGAALRALRADMQHELDG